MPSILTEPRYNLLTITEDARAFQHRQPYSHEITKALPVPLGMVPPFQFIKLDGWGFTSIALVHYATGTEYDAKAAMEATGFEVTEYDGTSGGYGDYDVWSYPGTVALPLGSLPEGVYYLRLEDYNGNYILIGFFRFHDGLELRNDYVKLEWWSLGDMVLDRELVAGNLKSTSHIRFAAPFKWWAYIRADLIGGSWQYDAVEERRDGHAFELKITKYKLWQFAFPCVETFLDAISFVPLHDMARVTYNGKVLDKVAEFRPLEPEYIASGFFGLTCQFKTQQTTNTVSPSAATSTSYEVASGGCIPDSNKTHAVIMLIGTPEYNGGYFLSSLGQLLNLQPGDYVLADNGTLINVRQWNGTGYNSVSPSQFSNWFAINDARVSGANATLGEYYYFFVGSALRSAPLKTSETGGTPWHVDGATFGGTLLQVVLKDGNGDAWVGATVLADDFNASGVDFYLVDNGRIATAYKLRALTPNCPDLAESEWYALSGVDYDVIESTLVVYPEDGGPATPESEGPTEGP